MIINKKGFMKSVLAIGVSLLFAQSASAGNVFTGAKAVDSILTNLNGSLFVTLDDMTTNPAGCSKTSSYFLNANGATGAKGMYAMILTAQASGQRVTLALDDTVCTSNYGTITAAKIVP